MAMASEKDSVPVRIPGYVIEREIGRGGVATVFLAIQQSLDRKVALKVMSPALAAEPDFSVRFEREGRVVAGFSHPNIVTIYDVGVSNFQHYIAMEFLGSGSLKRQLVEPMDPHRALKIIKEIAAALGYAHSHGYVHRDVKPENILFKNDGVAVLTDFGIAKSSNSNTQLTRSGTIVGTPRYMSPEQAHGNPATPQSDIYALGVILFEMLSGRPPFDTAESVAVLYAHINEPIPQLPPESKVLQPLVDAMMAKNFDNRVPDCDTLADLAVMLERELDSPTGSHRRIWRPVSSVEQQRREAAGSEQTRTDAGYSAQSTVSGEPAGGAIGAATGAQGPLNISSTTPRRRHRARYVVGAGAVAAAFTAAVLVRTGTLNQWINPAPELPRAVAILSDDEAVVDEAVVDEDSEPQEVVVAESVDDTTTPAQQTVATEQPASTANETTAVASVEPQANGTPIETAPAPALNTASGTDTNALSLAQSAVEPAADIDTTVPTATGTAVDPATVSGTMLAPPAPGTNRTPNAASDIATVAKAPSLSQTELIETVEAFEQSNDGLGPESNTGQTVLSDTQAVVAEEVESAELDSGGEAGAVDEGGDTETAAEPVARVDSASETAPADETQTDAVASGEATGSEGVIIVDDAVVAVNSASESVNDGDEAVAIVDAQPDTGADVSVVADSQSILPPADSEVEPVPELTPPDGLSDADVPRLLIDANILVGDDKLAHPPNDNAVELYQTVLAIAPDNLDAREGLDDIAGAYLEAAEEKIRQPDLALAALEIERGLKARPDHSRLIELQGEVRDMIEANAAYQEAENYFFGLDGPIDLVRSCDRYLEAAEKGHTQAALGLGICFANGFGFEQDEQQAIRWMNFAAEASEPEAMYNLALGLLFGDSPDPDRAAQYIRQAADLGYERAYRVLGWMHQTGTGVEQSTRDAVKWGWRGAIRERTESDSSTRKVVERWESVFQDAYNETLEPDDEQDDSSS